MARVLRYFVKASAIGVVVWWSVSWEMSFLAWASGREYLQPFAQLSIGAMAVAVGCVSTAILLVTRHDLGRVTVNVFIMLACTAFGLWFSDPMTQGSYDHGGGESEQSWLVGGSLCALIGYALTLSREEFVRTESD